jgi:hypothetical protein
MQAMSRSVLPMLLLVAMSGPVFALDQSAIEDTACLKACDANQEHCLSPDPRSVSRNYSLAGHASPAKMKPTPGVGIRHAIAGWERTK